MQNFGERRQPPTPVLKAEHCGVLVPTKTLGIILGDSPDEHVGNFVCPDCQSLVSAPVTDAELLQYVASGAKLINLDTYEALRIEAEQGSLDGTEPEMFVQATQSKLLEHARAELEGF